MLETDSLSNHLANSGKKTRPRAQNLQGKSFFLVSSFQVGFFQQVLAHTGHGFTKELGKRRKLSWKEVL